MNPENYIDCEYILGYLLQTMVILAELFIFCGTLLMETNPIANFYYVD